MEDRVLNCVDRRSDHPMSWTRQDQEFLQYKTIFVETENTDTRLKMIV